MNFKKYHVSKNLFDVENVTHETLTADGSIRYESAMNLSGLIRVDGDYTVSWSAVRRGAYMRVSTYDDNKNFIARIAEPNTYTRSSYSNTHTGYIRINYENTYQLSDIMLNTGSTALPYEPYGDTWHDTPHYIHKTSTDSITTLPAVLYPNDTTATVGLKGNMVQNGTPTPQNPVMPNGTGERTGNLWDENYTNISSSMKYVPLYVGDGDFTLSTTMPVHTAGTATQYTNLFLLSGNVSSGASTNANGAWLEHPRTVSASGGYVTLVFRRETNSPADYQTMLNTGSQPLPYEPYGYKIPISSANTTTPVYLGEVESTRRIKKLELTGEETSWSSVGGNAPYRIILPDIVLTSDRNSVLFLSTHYLAVSNNASWSQYNTCVSWAFSGNANVKCLQFRDTNQATLADFKSYLQQQYAADTPVTVWYVLATEETGIVNEPLRKIGTYADTLSNVTIPVTAGGDTLSVGTTLQPSEVTVNYKGWHPVQSVHERENGAWT